MNGERRSSVENASQHANEESKQPIKKVSGQRFRFCSHFQWQCPIHGYKMAAVVKDMRNFSPGKEYSF